MSIPATTYQDGMVKRRDGFVSEVICDTGPRSFLINGPTYQTGGLSVEFVLNQMLKFLRLLEQNLAAAQADPIPNTPPAQVFRD